jgi:hypothetical protein
MMTIVVRRMVWRTVSLAGLVAGVTWPVEAQWSLAATGGGAYALSDVEIVPGTDQNGGWSWDAGLRAQGGRLSLGVGYERMRLAVGPDGSGRTSGLYAEPRFDLSASSRGLRPYVFAHGARILDYDVTFCCSVYFASQNARGWLIGGGFGAVLSPVGPIQLDMSAGVHRLSGQSRPDRFGPWEGAGPVLDVRLGASIPFVRGHRRE